MYNKPIEAHRLLHFSDIHFCVFPTNPLTLTNKRFKGLLRQIFGHVHFQAPTIAERFPILAQQLQADSLCITGDFTLTALNKEFSLARAFVDCLQKICPVHVLPGNHDVYTRSSFMHKTFYQYFHNDPLKNEQISFTKLTDHWWLVLLDCSCLNGWFTANGRVYTQQISILENFLLGLPTTDRVLIANHYPLLPNKDAYRDLIYGTLLRTTLKKYANVHLYIHGHNHQATAYHCKNTTPHLILNSGSIALPSNARFHIIDLYPGGYHVRTAAITNLLSKNEPLSISIEANIQL